MRGSLVRGLPLAREERRQRWGGGGEEKGGGEKQAFNLEKCLKNNPPKEMVKQVDLVSKINNKM